MKKQKKNRIFLPFVGVIAAVMFTACLLFHPAHGKGFALLLLAAAAAGALLGLLVCRTGRGSPRRGLRCFAKRTAALGVLISLLSGAAFAWLGSWERQNLSAPAVERPQIFAGRNVLVISPHPDDEVLYTGGILEQYAAAGSRMEIAFISSGDAFGLGETRRQEAEAHAAQLGAETRFLGFNDGENDEAGLTAALLKVLRELRPDTVFCVEGDNQFLHTVTARCFDAALAEYPGTPDVFRGTAYSAWYAEDSFAFGTAAPTPVIKEFTGNLRLPVAADWVSILSPDLSEAHRALRFYPSQDAALRAGRVMRADRLFRHDGAVDFYKLTDENGSYLYQALTDAEGALTLRRFLSGRAQTESEILLSNPGAAVQTDGDEIRLFCPEGQGCLVQAVDKNGAVLDAVAVFHPTGVQRTLLKAASLTASLRPQAQADYYRSIWHKLTVYR